MLVSLLQRERIQTTLAKGKELRRFADKIISIGKKGDLHARRRAFDLLRDRETVKKLFEQIVPRLKDREGGYTHIYKLGWRQGDGAPLSLVELVTYSHPEQKKSAVEKAKGVLKKVAPKKKEKGKKGEEKEKKVEEKGKKEKKVKKVEKEGSEEKKEKPKKKSSERPPKGS
jgi:large subunit ribosomal protein L17